MKPDRERLKELRKELEEKNLDFYGRRDLFALIDAAMTEPKEFTFVDEGEPNGDMTCETKGYYKDGKFFITGQKLTEPSETPTLEEINRVTRWIIDRREKVTGKSGDLCPTCLCALAERCGCGRGDRGLTVKL